MPSPQREFHGAAIYVDHISGTKDDRPGLSAVVTALQAGDRLTVWKLDRLGRSMSHLVRTIEELGNREIQFRSLQDPIDTSTANGRLMFGIFAAMAQFERELIQERTLAGLAAARSRGVQMGRPTKVSSEQVRLINHLAHVGCRIGGSLWRQGCPAPLSAASSEERSPLWPARNCRPSCLCAKPEASGLPAVPPDV